MTTVPLPQLEVDGRWTGTAKDWTSASGVLCLRRDDGEALTVAVERCATGRLENAYPVSTHDIEIRVADAASPAVVSSALQALVTAIQAADPDNRKVVFATTRGDLDAAGAAEDAGFRYVVDVDLPDVELSLYVSEPEWVTAVDMDLDRVPGS